MEDIYVKIADKNIINELNLIGFDPSYINNAAEKYAGNLYKIFNLKPYEANILKQTCLSLGFDCAINRESVTCKCEKTDCILFASVAQLKKLIKKLNKQPFRLNFLSAKLYEFIAPTLDPLKVRNYTFDWSRPYIMGILNVTPDSFSDGGLYYNPDSAFNHCIELIENGADIIDIGGESTRPDALPISPDVEISRIIPVIKKLRKNGIDIPVSVDTRNYETAREAINVGADIINDVSGLDFDENLFNFVLKNNIPVVIMHSDKVPAVSNNFTKGDIVEEVYLSLYSKIMKLLNSGFDRKNIIVDFGIGFGKSADANFSLLKRADEFKSLNVPLLLGISRKSFIRNTFNIDIEQSDIVTALYSSRLPSINIHRVHNVKLTKLFLDYSKALI